MESIYVAQLVEVVENQHFTTENLLLEIASRDLSTIASQMSTEVSNTRSFNLNRQTRDSLNEQYLIHKKSIFTMKTKLNKNALMFLLKR